MSTVTPQTVRTQYPRKESLPRGVNGQLTTTTYEFPSSNRKLSEDSDGLAFKDRMRALESETVISSEEERFFPTAALIIFFSVLGALVRVGVVQLNTFPNEPVFPLVWAQVVGCLLYGFVQQRKAEIAAISFSLYVGLTTGLCGTITTFSSFMETTFRNLVGSPTFSSLGTHVVIVNVVAAFSVIGVTLGMAVVSILFGAFLSKLLPVNARLLDRPQYEMPKRSIFTIKGLSGLDWAFVALGIAAWIAAIVVLIITRNYAYFTGANLAFSCVLAPLGSLARWVLARINKRWRNFPTGTFAANIIGTTIRAVCSMVLIRSDGGHMTPMLLSFITGVKDGFCGGLTTLSTLANEMINLPPLSSVMYISVSVALSQLIIGAAIFPFAIPPASTPFLVAMPPVELCSSYKAACDHFLYRIGCPQSQWTSSSCSRAGNLNTMNGMCVCGSLDVSKRIQESIFDMELKPYLPALMNTTVMQGVFANWPINGAPLKPGVDSNAALSLADPLNSRDEVKAFEQVLEKRATVKGNNTATTVNTTVPNNNFFMLPNIATVPHFAVDICSTYLNACSLLLDGLNCPTSLRTISACPKAGDVAEFEPKCLCGAVDGSERVGELMVDSQIKGDIPFTKVHQPPLTINGNWSISICPTYQRSCDSVLQRFNCPADQQKNTPCKGRTMTQDAYVGECTCGGFDFGNRVFEDIVDNDVKPQVKDNIWESTKFTFWKTIDFCPTYTSVCSEFHARVGCPFNLQVNNACNGGQTPQSYKGDCMCGAMDAGERVMELITDFIVLPMLPALTSPGALFINN